MCRGSCIRAFTPGGGGCKGHPEQNNRDCDHFQMLEKTKECVEGLASGLPEGLCKGQGHQRENNSDGAFILGENRIFTGSCTRALQGLHKGHQEANNRDGDHIALKKTAV